MVDTDRRRFLGGVAAGALLSATGASAQEQEQEQEQNESADEPRQSSGLMDLIRFVHASPDTPAVDIRIEGAEETIMARQIDALDTHDKPAPYTPGSVRVTVRDSEDGTLLLREEIELEGEPYTLVLMGESCEIAKRPLQLVPIRDETSAIEEDQVRVRVVHALADAPALDVTHGDERISDDIEFGEAAVEDRPSGELPVSITASDGGETIATFPFDPPAGGSYTLYLIGYLEERSVPEDALVDGVRLGVTVDQQPTKTIESVSATVTVGESAMR